MKWLGLVLALLIPALPTQQAHSASFNGWTLLPYPVWDTRTNNFTTGPTVTSQANTLTLNFGNKVYSPGTPIAGFSNSGCAGLCSDFYYTSPLELRLVSPSMNVDAGRDYHTSFDVNSTSFSSSADYHVETPQIIFGYYTGDLANFTCCSTALTPPVGSAPSTFSIDFVSPTDGPLAFGLLFYTGTNPNGAASSSINPFTESGFYEFSDFKITPTPLPTTLPLFASALGGLASISWWRRRKARSTVAQ